MSGSGNSTDRRDTATVPSGASTRTRYRSDRRVSRRGHRHPGERPTTRAGSRAARGSGRPRPGIDPVRPGHRAAQGGGSPRSASTHRRWRLAPAARVFARRRGRLPRSSWSQPEARATRARPAGPRRVRTSAPLHRRRPATSSARNRCPAGTASARGRAPFPCGAARRPGQVGPDRPAAVRPGTRLPAGTPPRTRDRGWSSRRAADAAARSPLTRPRQAASCRSAGWHESSRRRREPPRTTAPPGARTRTRHRPEC